MPKMTPARTHPTSVTPAIAHGKSSARRRVSADPRASVRIGAAQRSVMRAPTTVRMLNATTKKTTSCHVTSGPEVMGSRKRKYTKARTAPTRLAARVRQRMARRRGAPSLTRPARPRSTPPARSRA
jgi:hypothetical protein